MSGRAGSPIVVRRSPDGAAFAKTAHHRDAIEALSEERDRLVWLGRTGLPVPRMSDWVEGNVLDWMDGALATLVTSALPGVPASKVSTAALFAAPEAVRHAYAMMHELDADTCPFDGGLGVALPQVRARVDAGEVSSDAMAALIEPERLDRVSAAEPDDMVVGHGRALPENVIVDRDTGHLLGIIGVRRLGVADRHRDIATATAPERASVPLGEDPWTRSADPERIAFYRQLGSALET